MNLQIAQFQLLNALKEKKAKRSKLSTKGKLEPSRLWHYKTSKLLFSEPIVWTGKDFICELILDASWSMAHKNSFKDAVKTTQNLVKLFHWVIDFRITVFATTWHRISINKLLSIKVDDFDEWSLIGEFDRRVDVMRINWEESIIEIEWGTENFYWWTWWPWVLKTAIDSLSDIWDKYVKYIVFITDWEDYQDNFWKKSRGMQERGIDSVMWIPIAQYNEGTYPKIIQELNDNNINILPIGLWIDLSDRFGQAISLRNPEDIYKETIDFITKH